MKKNLLVATLLAFTATGAMAQSNFEGAYGQVGIGYENASPTATASVVVSGTNIPTTLGTPNTNSFAGTVTLGYTFAVNKDFLLGVGGEFSPIQGQKQTMSITALGTTATGGTYNKTNSYNLFISPATPVGNDGLAYAKVGFTGTAVDIGGTTNNYTGFSLGLGYKQVIQGGLYGFAEVNYANYGNKSYNQSATVSGIPVSVGVTSSLSSTNVLVGLGYKF